MSNETSGSGSGLAEIVEKIKKSKPLPKGEPEKVRVGRRGYRGATIAQRQKEAFERVQRQKQIAKEKGIDPNMVRFGVTMSEFEAQVKAIEEARAKAKADAIEQQKKLEEEARQKELEAKAKEELTSRRQLQEYLLEKQGREFESTREGIVFKEGERKKIIAGGYIQDVPASATLRPEFLGAIKEKPTEVILSPLEEKPKGSKYERAIGTMTEDVRPKTTKIEQQFIEQVRPKEELTGKEQLIYTALGVSALAKGAERAVFYLYDIKNVEQLSRTFGGSVVGLVSPAYTAFGTGATMTREVVKGLENVGQIGTLFKEEPTKFAEATGQVLTSYGISKLISVGIAKELVKSKQAQVITVTAKAPPKKVASFLRDIELKRMAGTPKEQYTIDVSSLSKSQIEKLMRLKKEGVISSEFEIATKVETQKVGTSFKKKYTEGKQTIALRKQMDVKLAKAFGQKGQKQAVKIEAESIKRTRELTSPELETKIRARMKATGKTAKEIFETEFKEQAKSVKLESAKPTGSTRPIVSGEFKQDVSLKEVGGFKSLDKTGLKKVGGFKELSSSDKYVLVEEVEYIRGKQPIKTIILPTTERIAGAKAVSKVRTPLIQITPVTYRTGQIPTTAVKPATASELVSIPKQTVIQRPVTETKAEVATTPILALSSSTVTSTILTPVQVPVTRTIQDPIITPIQTPILVTRSTITQKVTTPYIPFISYPMPEEEEEEDKEEFLLEVRRGGQFLPFGTFAKARQAFTAGASRVRQTASASFRVTQKGQPVIESSIYGKEFRPSKVEEGVIVQRRERRISTPGELGEITFKGLATLKQRRRRRFL